MVAQVTYTNGETIAAASGGGHTSSPAYTILTGFYDATRRGAAIGDTIPMVNIPAGTLVKNVVLEVITGQATVTLAVGKAGSTAGYLAATAVPTAAVKTPGTVGALIVAAGDFWAAAGTIDLLVAGAATSTVQVKLHVICAIV